MEYDSSGSVYHRLPMLKHVPRVRRQATCRSGSVCIIMHFPLVVRPCAGAAVDGAVQLARGLDDLQLGMSRVRGRAGEGEGCERLILTCMHTSQLISPGRRKPFDQLACA